MSVPGEMVLGNFIVNPDETEFYVPIPKNGTNSLNATLYEWKSADTRLKIPLFPGWVFIRNPVDRWHSGLKEATYHLGRGRDWDSMIAQAFDGKFVWDNHTRPQAEYLEPFNSLELVKFDKAEEFISERYGRRLAWERSRKWDYVPELKPLIQEFYAADMELYECADG